MAKREAIERVKADFADACKDLAQRIHRGEQAIDRFEASVLQKRYADYVEAAERVNEILEEIREAVPLLLDRAPVAVERMEQQLRALVMSVEEDSSAVVAYEPAIALAIEALEARAASHNIVDLYEFSEQFLRLLERLQERREPFDFTGASLSLMSRFLECRDAVLQDPERAKLWIALQKAREELAEQRRHNQEMEEAEWEHVRERRKQTTAQRVIAAGVLANAYYARKRAKTLEESRGGR